MTTFKKLGLISLLVFTAFSASGCGPSKGEKALAAVQAREAQGSENQIELQEIAKEYRDVAIAHTDVSDKALEGAQRVEQRIVQAGRSRANFLNSIHVRE